MGNPWIHFWLKELNNESQVYGKVIRKQYQMLQKKESPEAAKPPRD